MMLEDYKKAKKIYYVLQKSGEFYNWHSSKQIAMIKVEEKKINEAVQVMEKSFKKLKKPSFYQIYDFAYFLKNNKEFEKSIKYYSILIEKISQSHELYARATDGRGIAFERVGDWKKAERDFLNSLKAKPNQAYVLNYLAYSWLERNHKIDEAIIMLEKAYESNSDDPYIIDSIGWAYYLVNDFKKAEKFLRRAVQLMPDDPIVNDHYGDILWKLDRKIQARYFWSMVLKMKDTEKKIIDDIKNKLIEGPKNS